MHVERFFRGAAHRLDHHRPDRDVRHEAAVHDVDMDPVGASPVDGADLLGEAPEIRRQDRRRDDDRPARRGHAASRRRMNFRTALAKPSFSLLSVTALACALTASLALPMAMERPLLRNIETSFGMSPMVAICAGGIFMSLDRVSTTFPLLASGLVTSR